MASEHTFDRNRSRDEIDGEIEDVAAGEYYINHRTSMVVHCDGYIFDARVFIVFLLCIAYILYHSAPLILILFCTPLTLIALSMILNLNFLICINVDQPPTKRRRTLVGSIASTALSAALIGSAVGLTVYRL
jgi:hypothetical protein